MTGTRLTLQEKDDYFFISLFGYNRLPCGHGVSNQQNKGLIQKAPKALK